MSDPFSRPLPALPEARVKTLAAYNAAIGHRYGIQSNPWADRKYAGLGDRRFTLDLGKIQRLIGVPVTYRLDPETMAKMLAHVQAKTHLGKAIALNLRFPAFPTWGRYNIRRPGLIDLANAKKRALFVSDTIRANRLAVQRKAALQKARRVAAAAQVRKPQPAKPVAPPGFLARLRERGYFFRKPTTAAARPAQVAARPAASTRPAASKKCICGSSRAEMLAQLNRLAFT